MGFLLLEATSSLLEFWSYWTKKRSKSSSRSIILMLATPTILKEVRLRNYFPEQYIPQSGSCEWMKPIFCHRVNRRRWKRGYNHFRQRANNQLNCWLYRVTMPQVNPNNRVPNQRKEFEKLIGFRSILLPLCRITQTIHFARFRSLTLHKNDNSCAFSARKLGLN